MATMSTNYRSVIWQHCDDESRTGMC